MSNWNGTALTNAFVVKNIEAFKAALITAVGDQIEVRDGATPGTVMLFPDNSDDGDFPRWKLQTDEQIEEGATEEEFNILDFIAAHLAPGQSAVCMTAGSEKNRYVSGWAGAVNDKGEQVNIVLDDIYQLAVDKLHANPATLTGAKYGGDLYCATMTPTPDPDADKVVIKWTSEDVRTHVSAAYPFADQLTDEQASELLDVASKQLKDRSIEVGWDILANAIDEDDVRRICSIPA